MSEEMDLGASNRAIGIKDIHVTESSVWRLPLRAGHIQSVSDVQWNSEHHAMSITALKAPVVTPLEEYCPEAAVRDRPLL